MRDKYLQKQKIVDAFSFQDHHKNDKINGDKYTDISSQCRSFGNYRREERYDKSFKNSRERNLRLFWDDCSCSHPVILRIFFIIKVKSSRNSSIILSCRCSSCRLINIIQIHTNRIVIVQSILILFVDMISENIESKIIIINNTRKNMYDLQVNQDSY